jgi:surface polysaccharide O-acyltransferase-like enzyme
MTNQSYAVAAKAPSVRTADYRLVDLIKFIMAILVIVIHRSPFASESNLSFFVMNVLVRVAVPFFFAASGFLFREKLNRSENKQKAFLSYLKRLSMLYFIWSAIYFPASFYRNFFNGSRDILTFGINYAKNFLIGSGSFLHLWYLPSLILSVSLVYLLSRRLSANMVFFIAVIIYAVGLLCTNYSFLFGDFGVSALATSFGKNYTIIFDTLMGGFAFTSAGFLVSEKKERINKSILIPAVFITFSLMTAEAFTVSRFALNYVCTGSIFLIPVTCFLISAAVSFNLRENRICRFFRSANTLIYFGHLIIFQELFYSICFILGIEALGYNRVFYLLATVAYSLVLSALIIVLEQKRVFSFLRKLH